MKKGLVLICVLFSALAIMAQGEMNNTKTAAVVKASYIYNFAKSCQWDKSFYEEDIFKISIYGDIDLYNELLDKYNTRPVNNQIIQVVWLEDLNLLFDEQIVYVSQKKKSDLAEIAEAAEENSSLLITDFSDAINQGAVIDFVVVDNTLSFDVNLVQANDNLIQLGNRMKEWANKIIE